MKKNCENELISFDYEFYKEQTIIKETNSHAWKRASYYLKESNLYCFKESKYSINQYCQDDNVITIFVLNQ